MNVIDKQGAIHKVRKYVIDENNLESVWCDTWYGRHVIGQDCELTTIALTNNEDSSIRTFTGKDIDVFNPDPDLICIEDIAHALSNKCRFGGHTNKFYSVAMHSLYVNGRVPPAHKLEALLHDASEAYLEDIPSPIKRRLIEYKQIEDRLMQVIAHKFGFDYPLSECVKNADKMELNREWRKYMINKEPSYDFPNKRSFDSPENVEELFLLTFKKLTE